MDSTAKAVSEGKDLPGWDLPIQAESLNIAFLGSLK